MTHGGWTVVQQRTHGDVDFNRGYVDYVNGFGNVSGDYWLGLEPIHLLMSSPGNTYSVQFSYQLILNVNREYELYGNVSVGDSRSGYTLHVTRTGLDESSVPLHYTLEAGYNDGMKFSAADHDVDMWKGVNCADLYKGGWWYNACSYMYINSIYGIQSRIGMKIDGGWPFGSYITNSGMSVRRN
jgi:hypothetical protein